MVTFCRPLEPRDGRVAPSYNDAPIYNGKRIRCYVKAYRRMGGSAAISFHQDQTRKGARISRTGSMNTSRTKARTP